MKSIAMKRERNDFNLNTFQEEENYMRARKKLDKIIGFYWHLAVYVIINIFLILVIAINQEEGQVVFNFGTFSTAFFWGIGLAIHWMSVFGPDFMFGKNWEEKKMKEMMDKDNRKWQ